MHIPFALMLAITGLGCQNKADIVIDPAPLTGFQADSSPLISHQEGGYSSSTGPGSFGPTPYPEIPSRVYNTDLQPHSCDWRAELRSTFCSFFLGHDPDVITIREIEASAYGPSSGW
jgi:hypothetical protein